MTKTKGIANSCIYDFMTYILNLTVACRYIKKRVFNFILGTYYILCKIIFKLYGL